MVVVVVVVVVVVNTKSEFIIKCRHQKKLLIKSAEKRYYVCFCFASFVTYLFVHFMNIIGIR